MEPLVAVLKAESEKRGVRIAQEDVFELLEAEACTQCCEVSGGGNKQCPPKTTTA
jgi:hypothetical protein